MPTHAENKIADLVDRFITDFQSGLRPDIKNYMSNCPHGQESQLAEILQTVELVMEYCCEPLVSEELVEEGMRRLTILRQKKRKLAEVEGELGELLHDALRRPVDLVAKLFGWQDTTEHSWPKVNALIPAPAGIMHRGKPGATRPNDWIVQNVQIEIRERALCDSAEALLQRTFAEVMAPVDVEAVARKLCLLVKDAALEVIDGCLVSDGELGAIVINRMLSSAQRRRFTIGHEIAHFVLHKTALKLHGSFSDGAGDFQNFNCSDWSEESEANIFASLLLMPKTLLPADFGSVKPTFPDIEDIADRFEVSLAAAARRLVRASHWRSALVVSLDGQVVWHALSSQFDGWQRTWKLLQDGTAAMLLAKGCVADEIAETVPAKFWFEGDVAQEDIEVWEESKRMRDGYIYTLLTVLD